jgi:histidinol-phosphate aminotransferase
MNLEKLVRPSILRLTAYQSARSLATEARVFLDANESPFLPCVGDEKLSETYAAMKLNRYPEPQSKRLLAAFAELYGVDKNQIFIGRGSDEAIDILTRTFCEPKEDAIVILPPTYPMYRIAAQIQDVEVIEIPLIYEDSDDGDPWII